MPWLNDWKPRLSALQPRVAGRAQCDKKAQIGEASFSAYPDVVHALPSDCQKDLLPACRYSLRVLMVLSEKAGRHTERTRPGS